MTRRWALLLLLLLCACTAAVIDPTQPVDDTASMVWPAAPETPRVRFIRQFDSPQDLGLHETLSQRLRDFFAGSDYRRMTRPYAVVVNGQATVVADPGLAAIHVFDIPRKTYHKLTRAGDNPFVSPIGVALGDGKLYIADSRLNKVFALDHRHKLLFTLDNFQRPTSLAFDPENNRLYVADTVAHNVRVFDQNGKPLYTIGGRGSQDDQFNFPSHLSFANGYLLVNDTMNFRVQVFTADGKHLRTIGEQGKGAGYFSQSKGVALDSEGHIYVADAIANHIQIFDMDGTYLLGFGTGGDGPGQFQMPAGLAIWDDNIYVADSFNQRLQIFRYLKEEN